MARRSDFTQKLLDDLRLRKEKLGYAQTSKQPAHKPDSKVYRNSRWSSQGSGEANTNNLSSSNMLDTTGVTKIWLGTRHHKTPIKEGPSQDIIPFSRGRRADHSPDVSMALALALNNSGKLQNIELFSNAMVGNKVILQHGSINFREMDGQCVTNSLQYYSNQVPFLSQLQLGEISKGIQNLNKILRAFSNGPGISRGSIDIGRELLKGAMDLEESLRMLVTLQEASDYMVGSKGKAVRLLKGTEEDESSSHEERRTLKHRTRSSFDWSSRHLRELVVEESNSKILEQNPLDLVHFGKLKAIKSTSNKSSSDASTKFISHRQPLSCGSGSKPDHQFSSIKGKSSQIDGFSSFSNGYNHSSLKNTTELGPKGSPTCEKVRIPNVVAKLMGLEVPLPKEEIKNSEVKRVLKPKKAKETSKTLMVDGEVSKREVDDMTHSEHVHKSDSENKIFHEKSGKKNKATEIKETKSSKEKSNVKDVDSMKKISTASNFAQKTHFKVHKQMELANIDSNRETSKTKKIVAVEGGGMIIKEQDSKGTLEQSACDAEISTALHPLSDQDVAISKTELPQKRKNLIPPSSQPHCVKDNVWGKQPASHKSRTKREVQRGDRKIEHNASKQSQSTIEAKRDLELKKTGKLSYARRTENVLSTGSTIVSTQKSSNKTATTEQLKEYQNSSHRKEAITKNKRPIYHEVDRETVNERSEESKPLKAERGTHKENFTPVLQAAVIRKNDHTPSSPKADTAQITTHTSDENRTMDEQSRKPKTLHVNDQCLKQKASILNELEQRWKKKNSKAEEATGIFHSMNSEHLPEQKTAPTTLPQSPLADDWRKPIVTGCKTAAETNSYSITSNESGAQQAPDISHVEDVELQVNSNKNQSEGSAGSRQIKNCNSLIWQKQEILEIDGQWPLTEDECIFKQILAHSKPFLSTAQALFKVEIPLGILQASGHVLPVENSKLLLECGYEVMRRKGKREWDTSTLNMSFAPLKARSFDALIKELNDDLESLKVPRKKDNDEYDTAECLHKMLERDIQNSNPDVNCMWDFGWNSVVLACVERDEVIRDVEKNALDGLVNELIEDLLDLTHHSFVRNHHRL